MSSHPNNHPILLFDGTCNYCNRWVNFIIRNDKKSKFRFAALQSDAGKKLLSEYKISPKEDTAILIENGKAYTKSSAGLIIMKRLGGIYYVLYIFILIPPFIRNLFYDIISRNRYKWWGKREECMIPSDDIKGRFL